MTDLEINKALALVIGWKAEHVLVFDGCVYVDVAQSPRSAGWRVFDYRDWAVIGPIAERYDAFPLKSCALDQWHSAFEGNDRNITYADTAQLAIALAVIRGVKT